MIPLYSGPWHYRSSAAGRLPNLVKSSCVMGFVLCYGPAGKNTFKWAWPSSAHVFPTDPGRAKRWLGDQPSVPLPTPCSPGFVRPSPVTGVHWTHSAWGPIAAGECQKPGLESADESISPCPPFLLIEVVQCESALSGKSRLFPSDPNHFVDLRVPLPCSLSTTGVLAAFSHDE